MKSALGNDEYAWNLHASTWLNFNYNVTWYNFKFKNLCSFA